MFRPRAFGNIGVGGPAVGFTSLTIPKGDHPVLPLSVSDPGWPTGSKQLSEGVVVFELEIAKDGSIRSTRVIRDCPFDYGFCYGSGSTLDVCTSSRGWTSGRFDNSGVHIVSSSGN